VNGVHDMGGMQGLGPVAPETDEPVFHEAWEGRVLALVVASPTRLNIDQGRHERERIPGPDYLRMTYFERWFAGLKGLLLKLGFVTPEEMASGKADPAAPKAIPRLAARDVPTALSRRGSYLRETTAKPAFAVGDKVRARNLHPAGHTRLPRYARGRVGVVERLHGAHVFADTHAHTGEDDPRPLYTVRFTAQELWGPQASPRDSVSLDLWEPHLERT
jgi:nitrile hydratase beta subunit